MNDTTCLKSVPGANVQSYPLSISVTEKDPEISVESTLLSLCLLDQEIGMQLILQPLSLHFSDSFSNVKKEIRKLCHFCQSHHRKLNSLWQLQGSIKKDKITVIQKFFLDGVEKIITCVPNLITWKINETSQIITTNWKKRQILTITYFEVRTIFIYYLDIWGGASGRLEDLGRKQTIPLGVIRSLKGFTHFILVVASATKTVELIILMSKQVAAPTKQMVNKSFDLLVIIDIMVPIHL